MVNIYRACEIRNSCQAMNDLIKSFRTPQLMPLIKCIDFIKHVVITERSAAHLARPYLYTCFMWKNLHTCFVWKNLHTCFMWKNLHTCFMWKNALVGRARGFDFASKGHKKFGWIYFCELTFLCHWINSNTTLKMFFCVKWFSRTCQKITDSHNFITPKFFHVS